MAQLQGMENLTNSLVDLFFAGSETTSTTLTWAMLYMIRYLRTYHEIT